MTAPGIVALGFILVMACSGNQREPFGDGLASTAVTAPQAH
jgi:hypothetical protein